MNVRAILAGMAPVAAAGALFVLADPASALSLRLSDGAASLTVEDNGVGDDVGAAGFIEYNGAGGSAFPGWGAISAEGSACIADCPRINGQLNAESVADGATLTLEVTETDLALTPEFWAGQHSLSGVADGSVTVEAFWDPDNTAFARTNSIGGAYDFASEGGFAAFADNRFDAASGRNPFSMTTVITFNHPDAAMSSRASSSSEFSAVPLPTALPLLGAAAGLLGVAGFRRRR